MLFKHRIPENEMIIGEEEILYYVKHLNEYKIYKTSLIKEISGLFKKAVLLELFSGLGLIGFDVLKNNPGLRLVSIESDAGIIRMHERFAAGTFLQGRRNVVQGNVEAIPFRKEYFNIVISANTFHHWENPTAVLKEMLRVTKREGYIFINDLRRDANESIVESIIRNLKSRKTPGSTWFLKNFIVSWRASYTKKEIEEIAKTSGLERLEVFYDGPVTFSLKAIKGECYG